MTCKNCTRLEKIVARKDNLIAMYKQDRSVSRRNVTLQLIHDLSNTIYVQAKTIKDQASRILELEALADKGTTK